MGFRKRPEAAFESLYTRHVRDVYGYALGVLGSSADAEDVTQTTFLNAYRALEDGKRPHSPRSWLFAIAHNVCRQRFRQAARRPREVELHDAFAVEEETDAPSASDIARALQSLPFTQRSALVMRELEGRSQAEIADALGVSVSAVETLLFRARRGTREALESALTCGEAARAISRQLDGASSRAERTALRAHLRVCEECATFARRARARSGAMRRLGGALPLPASLLSWSLGGGGAASGLGAKVLAGTAAVMLAAGATEQAVVHHDPPSPRAAAASSAPPPPRAKPAAAIVPVRAVRPPSRADADVSSRGPAQARGADDGGRARGARRGERRTRGAARRAGSRHAKRRAGRSHGSPQRVTPSRGHAKPATRGIGSWRGEGSSRGRSSWPSRGTRSSRGPSSSPDAGSSRGTGSSLRTASSRGRSSSPDAGSSRGTASSRRATSSRGARSSRGATASRGTAPSRDATSSRRATSSSPTATFRGAATLRRTA
jgi:RNA polymerase sigma factor (sigma-70 family)